MAIPTVDDYMNNEAWVTRIKASFDFIDINKNGTVEMDDWTRWVENMKNKINPDAQLLEKFNKATMDIMVDMGLTTGKKLNIDEYVKVMAEVAVVDRNRQAKGEQSHREAFYNALYEVVDKNHDGSLSRDEFCDAMECCNVPREVGKQRFDHVDANKNGKIERKEMIDFQSKLWLTL